MRNTINHQHSKISITNHQYFSSPTKMVIPDHSNQAPVHSLIEQFETKKIGPALPPVNNPRPFSPSGGVHNLLDKFNTSFEGDGSTGSLGGSRRSSLARSEGSHGSGNYAHLAQDND